MREATHRDQALPANRTRQRDAGLRLRIRLALKPITDPPDLKQPYFTNDEAGFLATLGEVRVPGI